MIVPAGHPPGSAGTPRPDHRGDIMDQRQGFPIPAQAVRDAPAESRAVDRHHGVGPERPDRRCGLAYPTQNNRCPRQDFGDTRHGNVAERGETGETLLMHALPADPGDSEIPARTLTQRGDQGASKGITRGFSSNQENEKRSECAHNRRTPITNRPARSAARMTSWRSSTMV